MNKASAAGISKRTAYLFQASFFALGFAMSNLTYADANIGLFASSVGLIVQTATILWFCKTYRGYVGKALLSCSVLFSLAVIVGGLYIYEARAVPKLAKRPAPFFHGAASQDRQRPADNHHLDAGDIR